MPWLDHPTRYMFFVGKGGVGKTSLSAATAIALADRGQRVLLVSTDPASNLDEMLGTRLSNQPLPVPGAANLFLANIDPDAAAAAYRVRVIAQMGPAATDEERASVLEQLSGACTTEIASFDEFSSLLADGALPYEHVIFDTAPTGHTLRLLSLPKAWSGFLAGNDRGASCLGPHSGLKMQEVRFNQAMAALLDGGKTTVMLVARPEKAALAEAGRTATELHALGLHNQRLVVNGVFRPAGAGDALAQAVQKIGADAIAAMPASLRELPRDDVPLRPFDTIGLPALRALLRTDVAPEGTGTEAALPADRGDMPPLGALVRELAQRGHGLVMVMGKGGVGKTTVAAALALALHRLGHKVHLTTTDPAAHLASTLAADVAGLTVSRIDPKVETRRYIDKVMATRGKVLDDKERALLLEDLQSPCTEEVAVFHAFSHLVAQAAHSFVVMDTAPTGHSLLLMDAAGSYHRQVLRSFDAAGAVRVVTPLMRIQDPDYTQVIIVALPETTPVSQAAALQEDLRRAQVEPYAWVLNRSLAAARPADPVLRARAAGELRQIVRIRGGLAKRLFAIPWKAHPLSGPEALEELSREG
jgi:arsenite/tail-anchored protein-transporting ATPase